MTLLKIERFYIFYYSINLKINMWNPKENIDYTKHYGTNVTVVYKNKEKINGIFVDLCKFCAESTIFTIKVPKPIDYRTFHAITNDNINKIWLDTSKYLHKKYTYCREILILKLPEEVVKKHIFSFLKHESIEI